MFNIRFAQMVLVLGLGIAGAASAQPPAAAGSTAPITPPSTVATAPELTEGEVRKVDLENKKVTLKHGPLANLDMPGMTMVFAVKDEAALDKLQPGQKVQFRAEKIDGKITVVRIQAAP